MRKFLKTAIAAIAMTAALSSAAYAAGGWTKENNTWVYYDNSGSKAVNTWKQSADGGYYYLDGYGNMVINSFIDSERYVDADGRMVTSGWRQINSKWYYFDSNGKTVKNKAKQINGVYYFFGDDGYMITGWVHDDNNWYYCDLSDGHMYVNTWKQLEPSDEMYIDDSTSNRSVTEKTDTNWFYFQSTGKVARANDSEEFKDYTINGLHYCFDEYGRLTTGWAKVKDATPKIAGYKYYNDDASLGVYGAAHTGWLSAYPPENEDLGSDVVWYYFDSKGTPYCGNDVSTNDDDETLEAKFRRITKGTKTSTFLFNELGNPVHGLRKVRKKDGTVTSMYFGTKQESCLQLGEKSITEADGTISTFHFDNSGYGTNGVKGNKLYYMGKLQKATDDSYAYYTVGGTTYLVNKTGTIVKNHNSKKDPTDVEYRSDSSGRKSGGTESDSELNVPSFETTEIN
ncbi:MAG: hypothetical protein MR011_07160 [Lachnospiraceae bacterium]|nr:hypothetical protein [Lachnospiraceae bacterium]